jgi:hypothetical protein
VKTVYTYGHPKPELISPDNWNMDLHYLDRPMRGMVNLTSLHYRTNVELYPKWQAFLRAQQPKTVVFWGQDGHFLHPRGRRILSQGAPEIEMHRLNSDHFAVEDSLDYIVEKMNGVSQMNERPVRAVCEGRHYEDDCDEAKVTSRQYRDERRARAEANQEQSSLGQISETGPRGQ